MPQQVARPSAADGAARRACAPTLQSGRSHTQTVPILPILHRTKMDVTRSVASPSDDIKKAAVFEKDALLSAQTMIYVRVDATPVTAPYAIRHRRDACHNRLSHAGRRRDEEDAAG